MYSEPLSAAIAEAEKLVAAAPHIETEADLLEGLQYLAGGVEACVHAAFNSERDHPFLLSGTGPFTKMGLTTPTRCTSALSCVPATTTWCRAPGEPRPT